MKTQLLASILVAASATVAAADPDFVGGKPPGGVPRSLALSDARTPIAPLDVLTFQPAQAALQPSATTQTDTAAAWLHEHPTYRIVVEGHPDRTGTKLDMEDLATRRAETVRHRLIAAGIASDRIVVVVFGERRACSGEAADDRTVIIYASEQPVREIALASLDYRHAEVAVWTQGGALIQEQKTGTEPPREVIASRP
jgi:outer membrane protein OmpA-like peptidoglycan-associated protein